MAHSPTSDQDLPPVLYLVKDIELAVTRLMEGVLRPQGLTMNRFMALAAINREPNLTSADLARRSHVSPQAMIGVVTDLEAAGFIARHADPAHSRRLIIEITPAGKELLYRSVDSFTALEGRATEKLGASAERTLRKTLAVVHETLNALDDTWLADAAHDA